jgi:hypothetical protein
MTEPFQLTRFLTSLTEQYHDLGHHDFLEFKSLPTSDAVNQAMDAVAGRGHRIKEGHSFAGLVDAYEEAGITGAATWFDHMLKDFTSPDGVPLPGASLALDLGMPASEAIDWMCVNAGDVLEAGAVMGGIEILERRFKDKPKLKNACLAFGGVLGVHDDNPVLVGYIALKTAKYLRDRRIIDDRVAQVFSRTTRTAFGTVRVAAVVSFASVSGLTIIGFDAIDYIESMGGLDAASAGIDVAAGVEVAVDTASVAADVADGLATLGLGIVASYGVKRFFRWVSEEDTQKLVTLRPLLQARLGVKELAEQNAPPALLAQAIEHAEEQGVYRRRLCPPQ